MNILQVFKRAGLWFEKTLKHNAYQKNVEKTFLEMGWRTEIAGVVICWRPILSASYKGFAVSRPTRSGVFHETKTGVTNYKQYTQQETLNGPIKAGIFIRNPYYRP